MWRILFILASTALVYAQNRQPSYLFGGQNCELAMLRPGNEVFARISGGRNVTEGEMPWMARLSVTYVDAASETCGGFILDENWIITAAHCLKWVVFVNVSVGRISYEWGSSGQHEQVVIVPVTRIFAHPNYDPLTFENDIGLVHLPKPLRLNDHVQPICILDQDSCENQVRADSSNVDHCNTNVISAGWGFNRPGVVTDYLKAVDLEIVPHDECQRQYSPRHIFQQQICVQGRVFGDDTCKGDSGGPLFCYQNGKPVAIAIVSFGPSHCGVPLPGGYNRICSHINWMKQIVTNSSSPLSAPVNGCRVPHQNLGNAIYNVVTGYPVSNDEIMPVGSVVSLSCGSGFISILPNQQSFCTVMNAWMPAIGQCQPISTSSPSSTTRPQLCPEPPAYNNAQVGAGTSEVEAQRVVTCNHGYESSGSSISFIYCTPMLQWTEPGGCERVCLHLPTVANGFLSNGSSSVNSTREITCNEGYDLLDAKSVTCLTTGEWTAPGICSRSL